MSKRIYLLFLLLLSSTLGLAQRNCSVFLSAGDTCRYEACIFLEQAPRYFQLTREFHEVFDSALSICSEYSDAYAAKSVAYLKTGEFIHWKQLIDQAVAINPADHLPYRAWCRFQFFRDYEGCLADLSALDSIISYDIGYSQNGMYHLTVVKALCQKMMGHQAIALETLHNFFTNSPAHVGLYDFLHLGVLHLELGNYSQAIEAFTQQTISYDLAENAYYTALVYEKLGDDERKISYLTRAKELYQDQQFMFDPYTHQIDKIYLSDIEEALSSQ